MVNTYICETSLIYNYIHVYKFSTPCSKVGEISCLDNLVKEKLFKQLTNHLSEQQNQIY